jgi:hypothetical protein
MHTAVAAWAEWAGWAIWGCKIPAHQGRINDELMESPAERNHGGVFLFAFQFLLPPLQCGGGWGGGAIRSGHLQSASRLPKKKSRSRADKRWSEDRVKKVSKQRIFRQLKLVQIEFLGECDG